MTTEFQKKVKQAITESQTVFADKITIRKTGEVEIKKSYFYRHGQTASLWADKVATDLKSAGIEAKVSSRDDWRAWPKDSYFVAIVEETKMSDSTSTVDRFASLEALRAKVQQALGLEVRIVRTKAGDDVNIAWFQVVSPTGITLLSMYVNRIAWLDDNIWDIQLPGNMLKGDADLNNLVARLG